MASSPRILNKPTDSHPTRHEAMQKARLAVHRRSACSGVKALRNTSAARRHAAKALLPFRSLAPFRALREPIAGDGMKNGFPAPNKEPTTNQKHHLTGKAPYRFESTPLQRRVGRTNGSAVWESTRARVRFRGAGCEQALGLAILAVVSVLGTWPPAVHHH
jgi:hypothetical protein